MSRPTRSPAAPSLLIGLAPPFAIGAVAWVVGWAFPVVGGPVVAVVIGLLIGQIFGQRPGWAPGVAFASKKILQGSIVLLGAGMSLAQVGRIGGAALPVTIGTLALGVAGGMVAGRAIGVERNARILVTHGTAICGASAIATMSAVIGAPASAIAVSVTVVVLYNVLAAVLFPPLGHLMGLSQEAFGLWAGTAVNDTSSVIAAAAAYGAAAASFAVVVKLTRTLALIPLAVFQTWLQGRGAAAGPCGAVPWHRLVPPFLLWFLAAAAARSLGVVPDGWSGPLRDLAHFGTAVAMGAVGMSSSFTGVRAAGWRPVLLGGILWILVAAGSLVLQRATGRL